MPSKVKVAVVTGANKGIGLAVVKALCQQFEGTVYLTARNVELGQKAVEDLQKLGLTPEFHQLDVDDEASIVKFKEHLMEKYGNEAIDILVNNAGISTSTASIGLENFSEQAEEIIRVNLYGTLHVCRELFPLLKAHARVVNVSSMRGYLGTVHGQEPAATELRKKLADEQLTLEDLLEIFRSYIEVAKLGTHVENGWQQSSYSVSKVAVSALTRIQQREFNELHSEKDLVINHIHPGYVGTDMTQYKGPLSPEEGSMAIVWASLLPPNVQKPRGDFIWYDKQIVDWVNGPLPEDV